MPVAAVCQVLSTYLKHRACSTICRTFIYKKLDVSHVDALIARGKRHGLGITRYYEALTLLFLFILRQMDGIDLVGGNYCYIPIVWLETMESNKYYHYYWIIGRQFHAFFMSTSKLFPHRCTQEKQIFKMFTSKDYAIYYVS